MFGRSKSEQAPAPATHAEREGAKNRPTPRRRDQEAARRRPLVVTDRKAARTRDRDERRAQATQLRRALETGDEAHYPARDRGPVRRYIRDYVDARRNLGEFLLPVMLIVLALSLVPTTAVFTTSVYLTWLAVIAVVVDTVLMWRGLKRRLVARFGADALPRGSMSYAVMRVFQMRRARRPVVMVKRGEFPD
ncbi:DUF3043 domain-containing protein [Phycicoccus endophyticus]|uniref:DUF3043 domain-containing protein n=1 Tax=Phycicoccus endophyticus TaxID=1690220 RepID=A0A7G9R508_9MICO|nr:DUF3043 domain-containing protein [Phycicoccus endophyticus]NHI20925.1 DUF3043 domain-containing protein [Phycicoccus endophyticus]QNN50683.1 DUF3043 domain-containing protein [Phycicoccus endophyticus]